MPIFLSTLLFFQLGFLYYISSGSYICFGFELANLFVDFEHVLSELHQLPMEVGCVFKAILTKDKNRDIQILEVYLNVWNDVKSSSYLELDNLYLG